MKRNPKAELELRKWCIEQANSWKWDRGHIPNQAQGFNQYVQVMEPNTISRAEQIYVWINKKGTN